MSEASIPVGNVSMSIMDAVQALEQPSPENGEREEEVNAQLDEGETESNDLEEDDSQEFESEESESEESEESEEEIEEPQNQTIKVKVDGEEVAVTLDELKSGYSRTKDYTKKTTELANQRKAFEAEAQAIAAERQQYQQLLGALQQQLNTGTEPDWDELRATDPIEYSLQMADWQRKQQKMAAVQNEQNRLNQLNSVQQQKAMAEQLQREAQALVTVIPEWGDKAKADTVKAMVKEQGKKLGFSDDELNNVFDHRAVLALHKAAKYDQLMAKQAALKPLKPNVKTVQPGSKSSVGNSEVRKRAEQQLNQRGDIRSAVNLLNLLEK